MKKVCVTCGIEKDEEEFNWRYKYLNIRHPTCRECHHGYQDTWFQKNKDEHLKNVKERKHRVRDEAREYVYEYLSQNPCEECGETDPRVLEFHHLEDKDRAVSELVAGGYSLDRIQREINKCKVLCASCHRKKTMNDRGWFRSRK